MRSTPAKVARSGSRSRTTQPAGTGKTTAHTDTFHGRFVKLVPNEQVVEVVEFETTDPALRGEMTITYTLADADDGTDVLAVHDGLPRWRVDRRQRGRLARWHSRNSRRSSRRASDGTLIVKWEFGPVCATDHVWVRFVRLP